MDADEAMPGPAPCLPLLAAMLLGCLVAGCGMKSNDNLPDLSASRSSADGSKPMNSAQQKQAIDSLIAKRDAQSQSR